MEVIAPFLEGYVAATRRRGVGGPSVTKTKGPKYSRVPPSPCLTLRRLVGPKALLVCFLLDAVD